MTGSQPQCWPTGNRWNGKAIADRAIPVIVGYANGNIGYIATGDAFEVGGYEPNASKRTPEAEPMILTELSRLADRVVGDVFESFSKHPKDVKHIPKM